MLRFFKPDEFVMDGVIVYEQMDPVFLLKLDECRALANVSFIITSSWRSEIKNKAVGGSKGSLHPLGRAVDIRCASSADRWAIVKAAIAVGLTVGVMENAIHLDNRKTPIIFHYYSKYVLKE